MSIVVQFKDDIFSINFDTKFMRIGWKVSEIWYKMCSKSTLDQNTLENWNFLWQSCVFQHKNAIHILESYFLPKKLRTISIRSIEINGQNWLFFELNEKNCSEVTSGNFVRSTSSMAQISSWLKKIRCQNLNCSYTSHSCRTKFQFCDVFWSKVDFKHILYYILTTIQSIILILVSKFELIFKMHYYIHFNFNRNFWISTQNLLYGCLKWSKI